jgi:hypothetical protein
MSKKTVGAHSLELSQKAPESRDPIEIQREAQKDYVANLEETVKRGLLTMKHDFYIVVTLKKEHLMQNVLRNYFAERSSCPTPDYDQTVFKYHYDSQDLKYMWTIPDKETCEVFLANAVKIVPEERELLGYILDFANGSLMRLARKENGEDLVSGIILTDK